MDRGTIATTSSGTKEEILRYLVRQVGATAQDVAGDFGISVQAVRRHLKDLEEEGLVQFQTVRGGMGRPQHTYELTPRGRSRLPGGYDRLAVGLLGSLLGTLPPEQAEQVLRKHWQDKGEGYARQLGTGPLGDRLARLAGLRREEGYVVAWQVAEDNSGLYTEFNCAIAQVAESFPGVCGHELTMFGAALPDCEVTRTHWSMGGDPRCGYRMVPR
ncbi:MAG: iron-sulfur cluster biosynthesis transcriptional regulator SufR [Oscillatoriales cyanobacterium SM2_1_8]|nr:iron-sulfur cluster biosynthesis transcriptional regulator SufR [Oscillatoriales cyanobacterium SM2_1_8]